MVNEPGSALPTEAPTTQPGNGMAIAGLVLGIISIVLCIFTIVDMVIAILAIIFGAIGVSKANKGARGKGAAMGGLICGIVGFILATVILIAAVVWTKNKQAEFEREFRSDVTVVVPAAHA